MHSAEKHVVESSPCHERGACVVVASTALVDLEHKKSMAPLLEQRRRYEANLPSAGAGATSRDDDGDLVVQVRVAAAQVASTHADEQSPGGVSSSGGSDPHRDLRALYHGPADTVVRLTTVIVGTGVLPGWVIGRQDVSALLGVQANIGQRGAKRFGHVRAMLASSNGPGAPPSQSTAGLLTGNLPAASECPSHIEHDDSGK